jgi:hypothetical protein
VGGEAASTKVPHLTHHHAILVINLIVVVHNDKESLVGSWYQTYSLSSKANLTHAVSLGESHLFEKVTGMIHHI